MVDWGMSQTAFKIDSLIPLNKVDAFDHDGAPVQRNQMAQAITALCRQPMGSRWLISVPA